MLSLFRFLAISVLLPLLAVGCGDVRPHLSEADSPNAAAEGWASVPGSEGAEESENVEKTVEEIESGKVGSLAMIPAELVGLELEEPEGGADEEPKLIPATTCGDGLCNGEEGTANCSEDCGSLCSDYVCNGDESTVSWFS